MGAAVSRSTRMTRSGRLSSTKVLGVIGNLLYRSLYDAWLIRMGQGDPFGSGPYLDKNVV